MNKTPQSIALYASPATDCNYLPGQQSSSLFADPDLPKNKSLHSSLSKQGFRRSGEFIYRPGCEECNACTATRIPVNEFLPSRGQRRTWKQNQDLTVKVLPARFDPEHFELYQHYLSTRHTNGGMDNPTPESYMQFLSSSWSETHFLEFRLEEKLAAIAVVDELENALSAVYTFFDPGLSKRSLGRFAILYEIEYARKNELEWLYLGYWIKECQKMKYKQEYQPQEHFRGNQWFRAEK